MQNDAPKQATVPSAQSLGGAPAMRTTRNEVAVEIVGLHKWFGAFHVLRDVSLKVMREERIVICGPSGGGKSTLLRCINRIEDWQQGRVIVDETFPERGAYYRSDHLSFARIGVPGLYFRGGLDYIGREPGWGLKVTEEWGVANYHQPSDEGNEGWNFDGMIEDTQLGFVAGLAVADADGMPTWTPGDEFAKLRATAAGAAATHGPNPGGHR